MTGEFGAIRKADYSQAWGKDSTNLAEYDYYLRAESQFNLYTKEGLERFAEISRQGLQVLPGSPLQPRGTRHWPGSSTTREALFLWCLVKTKMQLSAEGNGIRRRAIATSRRYMRLGREADARAAVEKMLKSAPTATIQSWRQTWNFRDPSILDQAAADLARAGLSPQ
ncbi:hypothetical protein [Rhizobium aethiopicum]